jgi:hypothetical protein
LQQEGLGSPVYVRYKDHVLFKNVVKPIEEAVERETLGWLTKQTDDVMLIEHDRTIPCFQISMGQGNGIIILKSCIIEIRELPLQKSSNCHLNSAEPIVKCEYALQQRKRKTPEKQKQNGTGANK